MAAKNNKKKQFETGDSAFRVIRICVALYSFMMLTVYPLYYQNKYFNMGEAKWQYFSVISRIFLFVFIGLYIWYIGCFCYDKKLAAFFSNARKNLNVTDYFVLSYLVLTLVSTILTPYKTHVIFGFDGWYMGLIAQVGFVLLYLVFSRFYKWDGLAMLVYLASALLVFYFAVIMRFRVDPMEMYTGLEEQYVRNFLSTLGQATWYSSYMTIIYPLGLIGYWIYDSIWQRIFFGIFTAVSFMTAVTQNSDSAYMAFAAVFLVLLWISFENNKGFLRGLEIMIIAFASFKFIGILQKAMPERVVRLDSISIYMSQGKASLYALVFFIILYGVSLYLYKKEKLNITRFKFIRVIIAAIAVIAVVVVVVYVYRNSTGQLPEKYASTNNYLLFNDQWGNNRGLSWRAAVGTMMQCEWPRKLFGAGPDSFAEMVYVYYAEPLNAQWTENVTLTCCHNEWLNAIVNMGFLGGLCYLGIFVVAFIRFIKKGKEYPEVYAVAISIAAYFCHNFFCYQQIICTPIIFILIGMGEALIRRGYEIEG